MKKLIDLEQLSSSLEIIKEYIDNAVGNTGTDGNTGGNIDTYNLVVANSISMGRTEDTTIGEKSVAVGYDVIASGDYSHAVGYDVTASGECSHAEGADTTASGESSHAEGGLTTASGTFSHVEGFFSEASGQCSHAEGYGTVAASENQHVQGQFNIEDSANTYAHIVGNGSVAVPSNAHTLDWDGNAWFAGNVKVGVDNKVLATKEYVDDSHLFVDLAYEEIEGEAVPVLSSHSSTEIIAAIAEGKNVIIDGTQCTVFEVSSGKVGVSLLSSYSDIVEHINSILTIDADKSVETQSQRVYNAAYIDYLETVINTKADIEHASETTEHGTSSSTKFGHAMASSTTPKAAGTANIGLEAAKFARGDHVHPAQTSVSGNAGTATKLQNGRTITIGNTGKTFDGSGNVSWSLSEIGVFPVAGGTIEGDVNINGDLDMNGSITANYASFSNVVDMYPFNDAELGGSTASPGYGTIYCKYDTGETNVTSYADGYLSASYVDWLEFYGTETRWYRDYIVTTGNFVPYGSNTYTLGTSSLRWKNIYSNNSLNTSDREEKENIVYIRDNDKAETVSEISDITYNSLYSFVRDDLELATYNLKCDEEKPDINFIAQDLLYNIDGTDNTIGQIIVPPIPAPTDEEAQKYEEVDENGNKTCSPPTLSYDLGNYVSVLAGALKETIKQVEELKDIVAQQQELINQLLDNKTS